jgi:hypothetical protein
MSPQFERRGSVSSALSRLYPRQSLHDVTNLIFWHDVFFEVIISGIVACGVVWALTSLNPALYTLSITHFAFFAASLIFSFCDGWSTINGTFFNPAVALAFFVAGRITFARCML